MLKKFLKYIQQNKICSIDDKILVAVSGGADSVILLDLFVKAGFDVAVAHCNFKLRGQDSDDDETFVKNLAEKYNVDFFVKICKANDFAKKNKISVEMAARDLRYQWFNELAENHGFTKIATAHHLDDNVETILLNLSRKTGIRGLTGIKIINGKIIRPLLFATKDEILDYVKQNNLEFRTDKTNFQTDFQRNKVRHLIIPRFREINPAFEKNVAETAKNLEQYLKLFENQFVKFKENCIFERRNYVEISTEKLKEFKPEKLFLFEYLKDFGFNSAMVDNILTALKNTETKTFSANVFQIVVSRNSLIVKKLCEQDNYNEILIGEDTEKIRIDENLYLEIAKIKKNNDFFIEKNSNFAYIDFDKIEFPLLVRKWQKGDYFYPFGMKGRKKLSDFFNDKKFTPIQKENVRILCLGNKIVWIIGHRLDNRFAITEKTEKILLLKLSQTKQNSD